MIEVERPGAGEYDSAFAGYVARLEDGESVVAVLSDQIDGVFEPLRADPESSRRLPLRPGKWSIKEVIGHLSDTERVFAYRALRIGRGDSTALPGFDDQSYVTEMRAESRSLADVTGEWRATRSATLSLFRGFPTAAWDRLGSASGHTISVRALAYIIAGHTRHHLEVIDARYGK